MIEIYPVKGEDYGRDMVEVIRCENCMYWERAAMKYGVCLKTFSEIAQNGYCSRAKRKAASWES